MATDLLPTGYAAFLTDLKAQISAAQVRAALAVNSELVLLYWQIGRGILERQEGEGWGAKVIDRLSGDVRREFPEMKGFSSRNLKDMRAFAQAWPDASFGQEVLARLHLLVQQVAAQISRMGRETMCPSTTDKPPTKGAADDRCG